LPRNTLTLFDRHGKEVFSYAKVHTSDFKPLEASMTPGEEFFVGELDTKVGPVMIGAMICFDREQPESARILMLKGAEIILTPNACKLENMRLDQFKIRAWENVVCTAMANYPSPDQNGRSVAYDASGDCRVLAGKKEGIYVAGFDLDALRELRRTKIWGNAYRRPHRYDLLTAPEKAPVWNRTDGNGQPYDASQR
jgi:predicted amidohydrolase